MPYTSPNGRVPGDPDAHRDHAPAPLDRMSIAAAIELSDPDPGLFLFHAPDGQCELAFVACRPQKAFERDIWTRCGHERFDQHGYEQHIRPRLQPIGLHPAMRKRILEAWDDGGDVSAAISDCHHMMPEGGVVA